MLICFVTSPRSTSREHNINNILLLLVCIRVVSVCWATVTSNGSPCYTGQLSSLSVTLVYCGQTVGWIGMPRGMEVGVGPSHIVLVGDLFLPPPKKGGTIPRWSILATSAPRCGLTDKAPNGHSTMGASRTFCRGSANLESSHHSSKHFFCYLSITKNSCSIPLYERSWRHIY